MPTVTTATFAEFAPKSKSQNVGVRKAAYNFVLGELSAIVGTDASDVNRTAVLFHLEPTDKALTVHNQIRRAATELGITVISRRKGDVIVAAKTGDCTAPAPAPAKRGRKAA